MLITIATIAVKCLTKNTFRSALQVYWSNPGTKSGAEEITLKNVIYAAKQS